MKISEGTQNTNECLNSTIWACCLKTSFLGLKRVEGSVAHPPTLTLTHTHPHLPVKVGHLLHGPDFDDFAGILFLVVIIGEAVVSVDVLLSSAKVHQGCLVDLHSHIWRDLLSLHTVNTTNISTFCELSYSTQQT